MKKKRDKKEYILSIFFSVLLFLITVSFVQRQVGANVGDHYVHGKAAFEINIHNVFSKILEDPHIFWHLLVKLLCVLLHTGDLGTLAGIVSGSFIVATYILTVEYMSFFSVRGSSVMAFVSVMVGPLYMPWINSNYYLGQGTPNTWHNPTNIAVKPFAVIVFITICVMISIIEQSDIGKDGKQRINKNQLVFLSVMILLSVFAKPSFIMAFIPALGFYFLILLFKNKGKHFLDYFIICCTFIPGVLALGFQFFVFFGNKTEAGIGIEWFRVVRVYTSHPFISVFLVLCFPVIYILCNFKREISKTDIQISLLYVFFGWLIYSMLYETGPREIHGNMSWAYLLSLYIIWMVTLSHFLVDIIDFDISDRTQRVKNGLLSLILAFHFLFGLGYITSLHIKPDYWI